MPLSLRLCFRGRALAELTLSSPLFSSLWSIMAEKPCTLLIHFDMGEPPQINELKKSLETGSVEEKIETLKQVILLMLNGESLSQLLMHVIRFVMPVDNHTIKKLLLLYWEIADKTTADGK